MLKLAQGRDRVESWEPQFKIPVFVNNIKICFYVCDFLVRYVDGRRELVEVKGYWTSEAKLKRRVFEATWLFDHPEITYRVVA